jgi:hypothetical protein
MCDDDVGEREYQKWRGQRMAMEEGREKRKEENNRRKK